MLTPMSREVELEMMGQKRSRGDSGALSAEGRAGSNRKVSLLLVRQDERRTRQVLTRDPSVKGRADIFLGGRILNRGQESN